MSKKMGVLGTGMVGEAIGNKLIELGYKVMMGSRTKDNKKANDWKNKNGENASTGTFDAAAEFGDILFLCVKGEAALTITDSLMKKNVKGKTFVDITNPLDFSKGMPPFLIEEYSNTNSLSEEIQKRIAEANVVKTLNIVGNQIMVNPGLTNGEPTMFLSGNNETAKGEVKAILAEFGWKDIIDLGDLKGARGMEMMLPLWVRTWVTLNNRNFAIKIVR